MTDATPLLKHIAGTDSDPVAASLARNLLVVIPLGWGNILDDGTVQNWGGRIEDDGSVQFPGSSV